MEIIEFFNREDNKYANLFQHILSNSKILTSDVKEESHIEKSIISAINTKLERAATCHQGLDLICNFSSKITIESLSKYFPHWITKATQILTNAHSNSRELKTACRAVDALIKSCKQLPELDRKFSTHNVKQLVGIIFEKYSQDKSKALLDLLAVLIYFYPESCARFQVPLSKILSSCIDDENNHLVISGAKCYSYLITGIQHSSVHASKDNLLIFPDNKSASYNVSHQMILCDNLCTIINELFQDIVTTSEPSYNLEGSTNINILRLPKIYCNDILEYYTAMENRFTNTCIFLSMLLKTNTDKTKKVVLPNVILRTICKGLTITPQNLRKNNDGNEKSVLLFILPKLQISLLNILDALIESFQQELLPFALTIQHIFLQTLEWTEHFIHTSFVDVRVNTYKILSSWLKLTGPLPGFQSLADELLSHSLKDLSQNRTLYLHALLALQSIMTSLNCSVKPSLYDKIKKTVVSLLYEIYIKKASNLTNDLECRIQLLRTLRILQVYPHISISSPTSNAIQIFRIALTQDNNPKIIEEARLGLAELSYIINPTAPTLSLPKSEDSSSKLTSSQLLQQMETIHSSEMISKSYIPEDKCDTPNKNIKRPRLEDCQIESPIVNQTKSTCKGDDVLELENNVNTTINQTECKSNGVDELELENDVNTTVNQTESKSNRVDVLELENDVNTTVNQTESKSNRVDVLELENDVNTTVNQTESTNNADDALELENDEMMMSFQDVQQSK